MIQNILVPTDFSPCASFAVQAAALLAKKQNALLHIISCTTPVKEKSATQELPGEEDAAYKRQVNNTNVLLKDLENNLKAKLENITHKQVFGTLIDAIRIYIEDNQIDLIVMGSHGVSGKSEYFIGSNTQKVVRKVHVPVLVVKNPMESVDFKKVVFASTFNLSDKAVFKKMIDIVGTDQPEIHLVMVNTLGWFGQPYALSKAAMEDFKELCYPLKCYTHFYRDLNVDAGIRHISEDINADLITISNLERHPIKRIFTGSSVEALVNHSEIPVLSMDIKQEA
jgi:nucleotide-binding universal stress UspA family protein